MRITATFHQGNDRATRVYDVPNSMDVEALEKVIRESDLVGPGVGQRYVDELVDEIRSTGHGMLGWTTWVLETSPYSPAPKSSQTCRHCGRRIVQDDDGTWIDPEAGYHDEDGDGIWRETCEAHDTFQAEHEPRTSADDDLYTLGVTLGSLVLGWRTDAAKMDAPVVSDVDEQINEAIATSLRECASDLAQIIAGIPKP